MKLLGLLLLALLSPLVAAENLPLPPQAHIVVQGEGVIERVPDIVELDIDIRHTAANFNEAKQQVDALVSKAIRAAIDNKVKSDDINASQVQATPQYEWQGKERVYKGEQVSRQLLIRLNKPEHYNELVNALLSSGISRLNRANFSFSNREKLEKLALQAAMDDARQQALAIASHMNIRLGTVYQVAPVGGVVFAGQRLMDVAESKSDDADLKPSKQKIQQRIRVVYLLDN